MESPRPDLKVAALGSNTRRFLVFLVGAAVGCSPDLPLWQVGQRVTCATQADCPEDTRCDVELERCLLEGEVVDRAPPAFLTPSPDARVTVGDVVVAWSAVQGAAMYTLEVSTTSDFSELAGGPLELTSTSTVLTLSDPVTYFLRLRADVTAGGQFATRSLHALDDAVYVYCPQSAAACVDDGTTFGTRTTPMRTIAEALRTARSAGVGAVRVAARGGTAAYKETVRLEHGISLVGGYNGDFSERDRVRFPTLITSDEELTVIAEGGVAADGIAELTGFSVVGSGLVGSAALFVSYGDPTVVVHDNVFSNNPPAADSALQAAVVINGRFSLTDPPFVFANNEVLSTTRCIVVRETVAIIRDNIIRGGVPSLLETVVGVEVSSSPVDIVGNQVSLVGRSYGVRIGSAIPTVESATRDGEALPRVLGNTMTFTDGWPTGMFLSADARPRTIRANRITMASVVAPTGINVIGGSGVIANNTVQVTAMRTAVADGIVFTNRAYGISLFGTAVQSGSDTMVVRENDISIEAFAEGEAHSDVAQAVGIDVTYANQIAMNIVNNRVRVEEPPTQGSIEVGAENLGIQLTSTLTGNFVSQAALTNNTVVGAGTGITTGLAVNGLIQTLYVINNLVGFTSAGSEQIGVSIALWPSGGYGAVSANAVIGALAAFVTPSGTAARAEQLTCAALVHPPVVGAFDPASFPTCANNVSGPDLSTLWTLADLALDVSLTPTASSPAVVRSGGVDASPRQCGAVITDFASRPRACAAPTCYSIGALEAAP